MQAAERAAWLRLISTPGLGPRAARKLLSAFGLPQAIFDAGLPNLLRSVPEPLARVLALLETVQIGPADPTPEQGQEPPPIARQRLRGAGGRCLFRRPER